MTLFVYMDISFFVFHLGLGLKVGIKNTSTPDQNSTNSDKINFKFWLLRKLFEKLLSFCSSLVGFVSW